MQNDLVLSLRSANNKRNEMRAEMAKISYYSKLFTFIEARFSDGETFVVKNYFDDYKMISKDAEGNNKTIYGLICDNNKSYLGLNDLSFPKRLYKQTTTKINDVETTEFTQIEKKVQQGDLAVLFDLFKSKYKDALIAMELVYCVLAKHNDSKFITESFNYPTNTYQRFKGNYTTSNFYMFNLKAGGTSEEKLNEFFNDICKDYEKSLIADETKADTTTDTTTDTDTADTDTTADE